MFLADAAAIKVSLQVTEKLLRKLDNPNQEVTSSRARFPKPVEQYVALSFFGHNIIVSEGEEWKKYRKISAPAFSDVSLPC
jgi:cytochrome P450